MAGMFPGGIRKGKRGVLSEGGLPHLRQSEFAAIRRDAYINKGRGMEHLPFNNPNIS